MSGSDGRHLPIVGIVGGIGSGKSALARRLADTGPFRVLDADRAGHHILDEPAVRDFLRSRFGPRVFSRDRDQVDRSALAREVFGDSPDRRRARADLEAVVHPRIRRVLEDRIAELRDEPESAGVRAVLLDAAVLLESGWRDACDAVVFVDVPRAVREERVASRGWPAGELARREASQMDLDAKRAQADFVVDNSGPLDSAVAQFLEWFSKLAADARPQLVPES